MQYVYIYIYTWRLINSSSRNSSVKPMDHKETSVSGFIGIQLDDPKTKLPMNHQGETYQMWAKNMHLKDKE